MLLHDRGGKAALPWSRLCLQQWEVTQDPLTWITSGNGGEEDHTDFSIVTSDLRQGLSLQTASRVLKIRLQ